MTPEQTQDIRRIQAQMDAEREALRVEREAQGELTPTPPLGE